MTHLPIRDVSLFVKVMGQGAPLVMMHGGPSLDHTSLLPLEPLADQFTLVFYDHRCNGRSEGAEASTMTFENLTADADALRQALGFDQWSVLGHSFGGNVALEYALRYPGSISRLVLMNTGGDQWWVNHNAPEILVKRGYNAATVEAARRFFNGQVTLDEYLPTVMKFIGAYSYRSSIWYHPSLMTLVTFNHGLRPDPVKMQRGMDWLGAGARPLLGIVASCALIVGLALVLPIAKGFLPWSASVTGVMMLIATGFHLRCREEPKVWVSLILFALAAFLAYGRWVLSPK